MLSSNEYYQRWSDYSSQRVAPSPSTMNVEPASDAKTLKALIAEIENLEIILEATADEIDQLAAHATDQEKIEYKRRQDMLDGRATNLEIMLEDQLAARATDQEKIECKRRQDMLAMRRKRKNERRRSHEPTKSPNAFLFFRQERVKGMPPSSNSLSATIAAMWNNMSKADQAPYREKAVAAGTEHRLRHVFKYETVSTLTCILSMIPQ
ncbi:hypothetical protein C8R46DRAFT_1230978 [Mycena filopes]|nr:hypothetical protein C8R46DRAFT_1230978 [Mycena filopes]